MKTYVILISAGVGPAPVRRFVRQLSERLVSRCEEAAVPVEAVVVHGNHDAPTSIELVVGETAKLHLADEIGTHALVARAEDRGRADRKRWFAGVTMHDSLEDRPPVTAMTISPKDLTITAARASGPGGQHVNKAATAVRVCHRPSGITVRVENERSQRQNLAQAIARITERLEARGRWEVAQAEKARRIAHYRVERGEPVRTYRLGQRGELVMV